MNQYLVNFCYLGFRYHGWAKQNNLKTVQGEIENVLTKLLNQEKIGLRVASRTDSMVSAQDNYFTFKTQKDIRLSDFKRKMNELLPADIRIKNISICEPKFSIISSPKYKTYHYTLATEENYDPMDAICCTPVIEPLNLELLKQGLKIFVGLHSFHNYCYQPKPNTNFSRTITRVNLHRTENNKVRIELEGDGFLRHQVRLIIGALLNLNRTNVSLIEIKESLSPKNHKKIGFVAPASGLVLAKIDLH